MVVVGRSAGKTAAVVAELPGAQALTADFTRLDDVRALAGELARLPRIDVLVNNAGASFGRRELTVDGYERTFQVDHLAPYLLTRLLERPLREARARVVTTASSAHWIGGVRRGGLAAAAEGRGRYLATRVYARAKWANVVFTRELARRWGPEVTATCFDPGAVATSFAQESGGLLGVAFRSPLTAFLRTPGQGADTLVWLATADTGWRAGGHHADRARARGDQLDGLHRQLPRARGSRRGRHRDVQRKPRRDRPPHHRQRLDDVFGGGGGGRRAGFLTALRNDLGGQGRGR